MLDLRAARRMAMALPEVTEEDHHGRTSFRIRGRIYATVPDDGHLNVMLDTEGVDAALDRDPKALVELTWGRKVVGVTVDLSAASEALVEALLEEAWRRVAPKTVVKAYDANR